MHSQGPTHTLSIRELSRRGRLALIAVLSALAMLAPAGPLATSANAAQSAGKATCTSTQASGHACTSSNQRTKQSNKSGYMIIIIRYLIYF